jgi:NAD(P)-dependent dehydrogenase (short-subunit alcohol dehydrogenase family)
LIEPRGAIVTAASRGIGFATAAALLRAGHSVLITARKEEPLLSAAERLSELGRVVAVPGHIGDAEHRRSAVARAIDEFGRLDVLVNNAAVSPVAGQFIDLDLDVARKILDTNVVATLGWVQEAYRGWMRERGGAIVNVSSVGAYRNFHDSGMYGVSKSAISHLTQHLAAELGPGIRVNAVAPGMVRTRFAEALYSGRESEISAKFPLRRLGEPDDIADAISFLLSDRASWITGVTLLVDGGIVAAEPDYG